VRQRRGWLVGIAGRWIADAALSRLAEAEFAYRLVQDWQPAINKGTAAAPGRASRRLSSGQAAL
jgi:hypothetical protein